MSYKSSLIVLITSMFALAGQRAAAQTQAYEQDDIIKIPGQTTDAQINALTPFQKQTTKVYYDGLGRPVQTVGVQASPMENDLIQPVAYDNLGRQTVTYLPYAGKSTDAMGSYRPNALSADQAAFYNQTTQYLIPADAAPYTQKLFENSPLQRMLSAGMAGTGFQPQGAPLPNGGSNTYHYKTVSYRFNTSSDGSILAWNPDGSYTSGTYYPVNTLAVTDATDEDNVETQSFTDLAGHVVLKRQLLAGSSLDTYYIYNLAGMIAFVVPPKALALMVANSSYSLTQTGVNKLIFQFTYNGNAYTGRGQLVTKTVPGKGTMSVVYDPLNRPVLMQDANMAANYQWNYIRYDAKGRAVSQGIYTDNTPSHIGVTNMQAYVNSLASSYTTAWFETRSSAAATGYYTANIFPTAATGTLTPLAYAYYDDYDLKQTGSPNYTYFPQISGELGATTAQVKGMPTMVRKATVGAGLSNTWLLSVVMYDRRGNTVQVQSNNQLNYTAEAVTDYKTTLPDFTGVPQQTKVFKATNNSNSISVLSSFTYDHMYRPLTISQQYNGAAAKTVAAYTYNEVGQVVQKNLGQIASGVQPTVTLNTAYSGTNTVTATQSITMTTGFSVPSGANFSAYISTGYLQTVDMRYNIRGQLLSINNSKLTSDGGQTNNDPTDLFGMQMLYDQTDANLKNGVGNTPSFDGKLTAVKWMTKDANGNSSYERSYTYAYDGLSRYTGSYYAERTTKGTGSFGNNLDGFDEIVSGYDVNGNITGLTRNSSTQGTNSNTQIDNLTYTYDPNNPDQLKTVTDGTDASHTGAGFRNYTGSTGSYSYDTNGNLSADPYKGITLAYDYLNRTDKITVTTATNRYINYTYDASGQLIRKQAYDNGALGTTTDYIDGFVYLTQGTGTTSLSYFPIPEGRVLNNAGTLTQEFVITDQQGNARLSFQDKGNGTPVVKQENSYYAFGMVMANSPVPQPTVPNKQLYNGGSEWQNDYSNLPDYYQTFYRNYDAAIGRFIGVDPQAEATESMTSYQYANNNPVLYNDPLGNVSEAQWLFVTTIYNEGPIQENYTITDGIPGYTEQDDNGNTIGDYTGGGGGGGGGSGSGSGDNGSDNNGNGSDANMPSQKNTSIPFNTILQNTLNQEADIKASPFSFDAVNMLAQVNIVSNQVQNPFSVINYPTAEGAFMQITYNSYNSFMYKSYQWIQTVSSSGEMSKSIGINLHNPHVDGTRNTQNGHLVNYPFYYTDYDLLYLNDFTNINTSIFIDAPSGETWFTAEATLIGIGFNGMLTPLGSYSWGYVIGNNGVPVTLTPMFSPTPSQFQNGIIQNYNNNVK